MLQDFWVVSCNYDLDISCLHTSMCSSGLHCVLCNSMRTCEQMYTLLYCAATDITHTHSRHSHSLCQWLNALTKFGTFLIPSNNHSTHACLVSFAHFLHHHTSNCSRFYASIQRLVCCIANRWLATACKPEPVQKSLCWTQRLPRCKQIWIGCYWILCYPTGQSAAAHEDLPATACYQAQALQSWQQNDPAAETCQPH